MVSKQSLEEWLARNQTHLPPPDDEESGAPEEISVSDILCEHDGLDPSKASRMKCINEVGPGSVAKASKPNSKVRLPTIRFRLPDACSRRCSTLATSVKFVSHKHIKVRDPRSAGISLGTKFP